jgi:hypothetical protein
MYNRSSKNAHIQNKYRIHSNGVLLKIQKKKEEKWNRNHIPKMAHRFFIQHLYKIDLF